MLLNKAAHSPGEGLLRRDTFIPGTLQLQIGRYVRRVGRPRQNLTEQFLREGAARLGGAKFRSMLAVCSRGAQLSMNHGLQRVFTQGECT